MKATPFKRDIIKELAAACSKQGIKLHFYYSHLDWTGKIILGVVQDGVQDVRIRKETGKAIISS